MIMKELQNDIANLVKQKLMDLGFRVSPSNKYTFVIENENGAKLIKVINTKKKYAHWKASKSDEEITSKNIRQKMKKTAAQMSPQSFASCVN